MESCWELKSREVLLFIILTIVVDCDGRHTGGKSQIHKSLSDLIKNKAPKVNSVIN